MKIESSRFSNGAAALCAAVVLLLGAGCTIRLGSDSGGSETRRLRATESAALEFELPQWDGPVTNASPVRGNWKANGRWFADWVKELRENEADNRHVQIAVNSQLENGRSFEYVGLGLRGNQFRVVEGAELSKGPIMLAADLSTARLVLRGERDGARAGGELEIMPDATFVKRGGELLKGELTVGQLLRFGTQSKPLEYIELVSANGNDWTWSEVLRLQQRGVNPEFLQALRQGRSEKGITGKNESTLPEVSKRKVFSAEDLVLLHSRGVSVDYVEEMYAAGTAFTAEELVLLRSRGVSTDYVREVRSAGQNASASDLVLLRSRGVPADYIGEIRRAGYKFSASDLVLLHSRGVSADYAKELKEAGYDFTSNDLVLLRSRGVPADYAQEIADEKYEPLKASEVMRLHQAGVPAETVKRLRK